MSQSSTEQTVTHNVGIVGGRGAGKTVYLAALYQALAFQPEDAGFYIEAPARQSRRLIEMFATLAGHLWVDATDARQIQEWNFTLGVMANQRGWAACKFNYYDYSGELIEEDNPDTEGQAAEIAQKLKHCQAIIALLDGQKIRNFITGEYPEERNKFIHRDLKKILLAIAPTVKEGNLRSLQFVITKWDHVVATGLKEPEKQIKQLLLSIDQFSTFLAMLPRTRTAMEKAQEAGAPLRTLPLIRLIPVSAVGFNFVDGYSRERGMVINPKAQPEPWNVAVPLACAFIDIMKTELAVAQKRQAAVEAAKYTSPQTTWERLKHYVITKGLEYIPREYIDNIPLLNVVKDLLEEHAYSIHQEEEARQRDFATKKEASLRLVMDNHAAFAHAATMCSMIEQNLDKQFPDNVLQ